MRLVVVALVLAAGAVAVPAATAVPSPGDSAGRIVVDGRARTYLLHVPPAARSGRPLPLVLALHGGGGSGQRLSRRIGLSAVADREGFVAVYPDGIGGHWNDGRVAQGVDDVGFVRALVKRLRGRLRLDEDRIYALGRSNGGAMVERLGCAFSGELAAIASVSGPMPKPLAARCRRGSPLGVVLFHGTADPLVPWAGGRLPSPLRGEVLSVRDTVELWRRRDGCSGTPERLLLPDLDPRDGARVWREASSSCRNGTGVVLYGIEGGGHGWPGGTGAHAGPLTGDVDATRLIWRFFERHPRLV